MFRHSAPQHAVSWISLAIPSFLLAILVAMLLARLDWSRGAGGADGADAPPTVIVAPHSFAYRSAGEFYKGGYAVDGPMLQMSLARPVEIMKYQVSEQEYGLCTDEGACPAPDRPNSRRDNVPMVGVSYDDAEAYAGWLSQRTGQVWRLPKDEELAFAAGRNFPDDALGVDPDEKNPALRWLADYRREAARKASVNPTPQVRGSFGESEFGLVDFGGNIWEWTQTCNRRVNLDKAGNIREEISSCGIYLAVGKHRAPLSSFIRDPKGGGCAVGAPPDNLGFRLVRETGWGTRLFRSLVGRTLD